MLAEQESYVEWMPIEKSGAEIAYNVSTCAPWDLIPMGSTMGIGI